MDWRRLPAAELEAHYNPRIAVPDFARHFEAYKTRSAESHARIGGQFDLRYGPGPLQTYDLHAPAQATGDGAKPGQAKNAPLLIVVHGGYWRGLDKSLHGFLVEPFFKAGAVVANINYDLCPAVSLDAIVRQTQEAIAHLAAKASSFGADPARLHLLGHSAGAHLVAAAYALPWPADLGARPKPASLTLVSGIYDPEPVLHIPVNAEVGLDGATARRNNVIAQPLRLPQSRVLVAVGDAEPASWIEQSLDFHAACRDVGTPADLMRISGGNHFSILYALAEAKQPLASALIRMMGFS